jgi:hypothetical protein
MTLLDYVSAMRSSNSSPVSSLLMHDEFMSNQGLWMGVLRVKPGRRTQTGLPEGVVKTVHSHAPSMSLRCPWDVPGCRWCVPSVSLSCPRDVPVLSLACPSVSLACPSVSLGCPSAVPGLSLCCP